MNFDNILDTPTLKQGSFKFFLENNEKIKNYLEKENIDPIKGAAFFSGLLTQPVLQSNTLRLEALIHIILASCTSKRKLNIKSANNLFKLLSNTFYGYGEDPAEDVFVSNIICAKGNFRIFEGIWESNTFTLQRFIDILNHTPDLELFNEIKTSVYSLLKLSEEIAERANINRYSIGNDYPLHTIPDAVLEKHSIYSDYIKFSYEELVELEILPEKLTPFVLEPESFNQILNVDIGDSILETKPMVIFKNEYYVILPTSIGLAIKKFIVTELDKNGYLNSFENFLARAYSDHFRNIPLLGELNNAPIIFKQVSHYYYAEFSTEIDNGRYIHLIFFLDNFSDYNKGWINSISPNSEEIGEKIVKSIVDTQNHIKKESGFKEGLTLIVACGWGRTISFGLNLKNDNNWRVKNISEYDLTTISLMIKFNLQTLFRLFEAEEALNSMNSYIMNANRILNLYSWAIAMNHHLIPHENFNDGDSVPHKILIDQNSLLNSRHQVLNHYDEHIVKDIDGNLIHVRRKNVGNYFKEDDDRPIYVSVKDLKNKELVSLIEGENLNIWCSITVLNYTDRSLEYKIWEAVSKWISLLMSSLNKEKKLNTFKTIKWNLIFESLYLPEERIILSDDKLDKMVNVISEDNGNIISNFKTNFIYGFFSDTNVCEKVIIKSFLQGIKLLVDHLYFNIDDLLNNLMPSEYAKNIHLFTAKEYRDFFTKQLTDPVFIDKFDDSTLRFGLGWLARKPEDGNTITGVESCNEYLRLLMNELIKKMNNFYQKFNRYDLIFKLLMNHESLQLESDSWNNTAKSVLSIQKDIQNCYDVISNKQFEYKGSAIGSRLAIEIALCECPLKEGDDAGIIDISKIITYSSCIHHLGGWSDAIRYGLLEPMIKISPYGQILMYYNSLEEVVQPYGKALEYDSIDRASENYSKLYKEPEFVASVDIKFEDEFINAWDAEFGFSIDVGRCIIDCLEDKGSELNKPVYSIKYIELIEFLKCSTGFNVDIIESFIERFKLVTRGSWTSVPQGYRNKDVWLWKFKRRLSVISKPIIQIEISDNPTLLITPALIRDGFIYILRGCYSYVFEEDNFQSHQMRTWIGSRRNEIGHKFNKEVAEELVKLGWNAKPDVKLTELLNMKLDKDYGDIDVFAWNEKTNRILLIECKRLNLAKTYGEIAEQLYEFKGELDEKGKPDRLKKHLIRKDICIDMAKKVYKYTNMDSMPEIETHIVFSHVVPMIFSKNKKLNNVKISIFDKLPMI